MSLRVVLTTFGSLGDVNPYLAVARRLGAAGHRPVIATSPHYRCYVERAGVEFHPVRPDVDPGDRATVARIMDPRRGTEFILREILIPALRDSLLDLEAGLGDADVLLTHPITLAGPIAAARTGVPWASSVLAPMSFFSEHDLPVFPPAPWLKRLERLPGASRLLVRMAKRVTRGWSVPVDALRAELGLAPAPDPVFEGQHSPGLVLALFTRLLATPQPDWPAHVVVTGHPFYNAPGEAGPAPDLARFLDAGPPPVVFTLGSSAVAAAGRFYEESAAAARRLGLRAVLLVGQHPENRAAVAPGADLFVADYAPHAELFPRAAAVVHQGGIGTLAQALAAGQPMVVVPFGHDQPDNAWRVTRLGVARTIRPPRYRARAVAAALGELLGDGEAVRRAREAGALVRREDGAGAAAAAIASLAAR